MTNGIMIYTGECNSCTKPMQLTIPATEGTVKEKGKKRVYCSQCRNINELEQTGAK